MKASVEAKPHSVLSQDTFCPQSMLSLICGLTDRISLGFFVYTADDEERLIYANQSLAGIFGCESVEELMSQIGGTFHGFMHPEDHDRVHRQIDEQIGRHEVSNDYVEYRIIRKDRSIGWVADYGYLAHNDDGRDYFYVLIVDVTDRSERGAELRRENENVRTYLTALQTLGSTYNYVYQVERGTKAVRILHGDSGKVGVTQALVSEHAYELTTETYIRKNVYHEDRQLMIQALDFGNLCHHLEHRAVFRQNYRVLRDGQIHYYSMKAVRDGDADSYQNIYMRFACEDDEVAAAEAARNPARQSTGKRQVLVIEHSPKEQAVLSDILTEEYTILQADNALEGLRLLEKHVRDLSLVLLNIDTPVMNGYEFLECVKQDKLLSTVPVIVMTDHIGCDTEARCMKLGAVEYLEKPFASAVMLSRIRNMIHIRENAVDLSRLEYDDLTGLYTRQAFYHYASALLKNDRDTDYTLLVTDIDDFKQINSLYGDLVGDDVLRYLAASMRKVTHGCRGLVGHYGADRFVVMLDANAVPGIDAIGQWLKDHAEAAPVQNMRMHAGMYERVDKSLPINRICDRAISAMNAIKHSYTMLVGTYDGPFAAQRRLEYEMETTFETSMANGEFEPWLQPKYDLATGIISGAQALARWRKPDGTMVMPAHFIQLFERDGLIVRLDEYMFRQVCRIQAERIAAGLPTLPISVNMSRITLLRPGTAALYRSIVKMYGVPPSIVPVEITESASLYAGQIENLSEELKAAGFVLHMDDFGSGFSSLNSLGILPFDCIKLDKSLTDGMNTEKGRTIVSHTIGIIHALGMTALAEGAETAEQIDFLRKQGCDTVQGYYFDKPMPVQEFVSRVNAQHID